MKTGTIVVVNSTGINAGLRLRGRYCIREVLPEFGGLAMLSSERAARKPSLRPRLKKIPLKYLRPYDPKDRETKYVETLLLAFDQLHRYGEVDLRDHFGNTRGANRGYQEAIRRGLIVAGMPHARYDLFLKHSYLTEKGKATLQALTPQPKPAETKPVQMEIV